MKHKKIIGFTEVAQIAVDELFAEKKIPEALRVHIVLKDSDLEGTYRLHFVDRRFLTFTCRPRQDFKEAVKDAVLREMFPGDRG